MQVSNTFSARARRAARFVLVPLLVIVMALFVTACGDDDSDSGGDTDTETTTTQSTETETETTETESTEEEEDPTLVAAKEDFSNNCGVCHGATGAGGNGGPELTASTDVAANAKQIAAGGGGMPAFAGQLTDEEIQALATYVATSIAK